MRDLPPQLAGGLFTRAGATSSGLSWRALQALVDLGVVRRLQHGVYVDAAVPDSRQLRAQGLRSVGAGDAVIWLRSAAWLWGVDADAMSRDRTTPDLDVLRPAGRSAPRRTSVVGRSGPLPVDHLVEVDGVVVTTPARTAADLARLLPRPDALAALDAMARLASVDLRVVSSLLEDFAGYRGIRQARELITLADPRSESPMESRTRLRAYDAGFPPLEPQVEVYDADGLFVARLDLARREDCRAVEYDGADAHTDLADLRHDRRRREALNRCGWEVMVVTSAQVLSRRLAFEHGLAELLGCGFRLSRHHPARGGWDPQYGGA